MNKLIQVTILISFLTLSSCFDVIDEITLNSDGSGKFGLTVNLSKSKTKIATMMALKDGKTPSEEEIRKEFGDIVNRLKTMNGISELEQSSDFDNFIFTLGFEFNTVENLNEAIAQIVFDKQKEDEKYSINYQYNKANKQFTRDYNYIDNSDEVLNNMKVEDQDFLKEAFYTSICRFSEEVSTCSNREAKISKSGKSVMLRSTAYDLMVGKSNMSNTIVLK